MAFGLGGSSSKSKSKSESAGSSFGVNLSNTYLDPQQQANQQYLVNQYQQAMPGLGQTPGLAFTQNQLMPRLGGTATQSQMLGNRGQWWGTQGMNQLNNFAQQANPYLQAQIGGLAQDAGQFFREQVLPGIGSNAQLAGQRGSSRQGVAEGLAAQRVGQEFMQAANQMRFDAYGQQQQAAQALSGLGLQGAATGYGNATSALAQQGALANQFANTNLQAQFLPFQIGSQVIGAPQILSQAFGLDLASQYSKSSSSGKDAGLNLAIG